MAVTNLDERRCIHSIFNGVLFTNVYVCTFSWSMHALDCTAPQPAVQQTKQPAVQAAIPALQLNAQRIVELMQAENWWITRRNSRTSELSPFPPAAHRGAPELKEKQSARRSLSSEFPSVDKPRARLPVCRRLLTSQCTLDCSGPPLLAGPTPGSTSPVSSPRAFRGPLSRIWIVFDPEMRRRVSPPCRR